MTVSDAVERNGDVHTVRQRRQTVAPCHVKRLKALQLSKPFGEWMVQGRGNSLSEVQRWFKTIMAVLDEVD